MKSENVNLYKLYKKILKDPWPYWIGAAVIAVLNIILLYKTNTPLRVSTGFLYWGSSALELLGFDPASWDYFELRATRFEDKEGFINNYYTYLNIAIVLGAFISTLWASQFKIKKIKDKKQLIFALTGGIIMGYGSRLAFGCNIGAYFTAISSFSLHGWIFAIFMFVGAYIGTKILLKFIM